MDGYNATIFAYGFTGGGKTYTMAGASGVEIATDGVREDSGIIPRSIFALFRTIGERASKHPQSIFMVNMSYVELYNNQFRNLLEQHSSFDKKAPMAAGVRGASRATYTHPQNPKPVKISIRENKLHGVYLSSSGDAKSNLTVAVTSAEQAIRLYADGHKQRAMGSTKLNTNSSRSHCILTFHIESQHNVGLRLSGCSRPPLLLLHSSSSHPVSLLKYPIPTCCRGFQCFVLSALTAPSSAPVFHFSF